MWGKIYELKRGKINLANENKKMPIAETVRALAEPLAQELGIEIWDVVYIKEGADWYLRVFIDKENGVGIEDCVNLTHALNPVLDSKDPISGEYIFEVSSPGINRKLSRPEHFKAYIGKDIRVSLIRALEDGTKEIEGVLLETSDNGEFTVEISEELTVTFAKKECSKITSLDDSSF